MDYITIAKASQITAKSDNTIRRIAKREESVKTCKKVVKGRKTLFVDRLSLLAFFHNEFQIPKNEYPMGIKTVESPKDDTLMNLLKSQLETKDKQIAELTQMLKDSQIKLLEAPKEKKGILSGILSKYGL